MIKCNYSGREFFSLFSHAQTNLFRRFPPDRRFIKMVAISYIFGGIMLLIAIALIVLVLFQSSKKRGLSGAIGGTSSDSYFGKNQGQTKEKKLSRRERRIREEDEMIDAELEELRIREAHQLHHSSCRRLRSHVIHVETAVR